MFIKRNLCILWKYIFGIIIELIESWVKIKFDALYFLINKEIFN